MKAPLRTLALAAFIATGACTQTFDATSLGVPATMAALPGDTTQGTPFRTSGHTIHGLFGLLPISQANLRKALSRQLVGGQGISNLKIKTKSRWFDVLITGLTLGLVVPRTVIYEGTITGR